MSQTKIRTSSQAVVDADLAFGGFKGTGLGTPTVSTDAATKGYVDGILAASDAMLFKGVIDCSTNPNYPAADAGHTYKISVAGKIGGASGVTVSIGDLIMCTADGTASGDQATVGASWDVVHVADGTGTVTSTAATPLDNQITRLDSTTGTVIQNSLATIDDSGSINIPTGQSYKVNGSALVSNLMHSGDVTDSSGVLTVTKVNGVSLAGLATGLLKNTTGTGAPSIAAASDVTGQLLTGYSSGAGMVAGTDSILQAIQKLNGNDAALANPSFATRETPSGTQNGTNPTFTLANTPTAGSEMLFLNGVLMNVGAGNDYTISGATITMLTGVIPVSTDILLCSYRY